MYRIGIDTGGTFTDLYAISQAGDVRTAKCPSTPSAPQTAVFDALTEVGIEPSEIDSITLGTTIATNARLQGLGATVLYVTTKGFEDVPVIGEMARRYAYDLAWRKPPSGVLRRHTFGVEERVGPGGSVVEPLTQAALEDLGARIEVVLEEHPNEEWAFAVNTLFSYVNPSHEVRIGKYLSDRFSGVEVSLSSQVCPTWREYERGSTTITDATIKPLLTRFVNTLREGLADRGYTCPLALMKSNGGQSLGSQPLGRPVDLLLSGLAGGVIAGQVVGTSNGLPDTVSFDMGGTSTDVALISGGNYQFTTSYEVEWGVPIAAPFIDLTCVGAGGGSIAALDDGGLLKVGPESAGAHPGPACYGLGGQMPTVTDANVVLGRLEANRFLGGTMSLDPELARAALAPLADKLEMSVENTALAILDTAAENMAGAIRLLTVERGSDPRGYALAAFGGAGGLHAAAVADRLGIETVIVPADPGLSSAGGTLRADRRVDRALTVSHRSDSLDYVLLSDQFDALETKALEELRGEGFDQVPAVERLVSMRYLGQNFGQLVALPEGQAVDEGVVNAAIESLHERHVQLYGYSLEESVVEVTEARVIARGEIEQPDIRPLKSSTEAPQPAAQASLYDAEEGYRDAPAYDREQLCAGQRFGGPAIVFERDSTTFVPRGCQCVVGDDGALVLTTTQVEAVAKEEIDPTSITVCNNKLKNICDEMSTALVRTAYSPIFSEARDFSCMVFDRKMRLVGQADMNPAIICAGLHTVPFVVEEVGIENFRPGDVYCHNDPYRGSCHMPEHLVLKGVFDDEHLIGFVATIGHVGEIGGMAVGSFASTATEVFQEGLRLPPVLLMNQGEYAKDVWRIMLANHRTPHNTWGDFHAMIGSLAVGEKRVQELVDELGLDRFERICDELIDYAERWMRSQIASLPDGVYSFEETYEDDGVEDGPFYIRVGVKISGDEMIIDFSDSDPQTKGPINCTYVATSAATLTAVLQAISVKSAPLNSGCLEAVTMVAPPGSLVNVAFPGPSVAGNTEGQGRIITCIHGALSQAIPERIPAADGGTACSLLLGGIHPGTSEYYAHYQLEAPGWGAFAFQDGGDAQSVKHGSSLRLTSVEIFESRFPLRQLKFELRTDSSGLGTHRGGLGTCRVYEVLSDSVTVSSLTDRLKSHPWGLRGGEQGATGGTFIRPRGSTDFQTASELFDTVSPTKFVNITLSRGDQIMVLSPGGGGYGSVADRSDAELAADLTDRYVSAERLRALGREVTLQPLLPGTGAGGGESP